jgi:hypothetical protein
MKNNENKSKYCSVFFAFSVVLAKQKQNKSGDLYNKECQEPLSRAA